MAEQSTTEFRKRRVVVTGVGLVSGLGIGTELTWSGLIAGKSAIAPITLFDTTGFACRFAGEVKDFDPANWIERKEVKKLGRFMMFAIAAADEALASSGLKIDASNAENVGVYIGSGIGGFEDKINHCTSKRSISPCCAPGGVDGFGTLRQVEKVLSICFFCGAGLE